ncbi:helix-turn-helix domain-containing protein [Corynebacterium rouxii]|uniref:Transcriptional regulator n=1 Tax=Corynebacterium rouxii TaxID=2719119 RepID=A0A6I8MG75_9CORY|nr:AraC family transcriptional regulator [Corynebacterium rouxii]VZH84884.1 transcriptional regulator [Corynebacterium rouxii]
MSLPSIKTANSYCVVLWCDQGSATINAPDRVVQVMAGDVVLAPHGAFVTGHGVVLPMAFPDFDGGQHTRRLHMGTVWSKRMIFEFSRSLLGETRPSECIAALFDDRARPPQVPEPQAARKVAQKLIAYPADQTPLLEFAQLHNISSRTLQRQFVASTGFTFSEWRAALRVSVAADLLAHDFRIGQVSQMVGFSATSSLTRAFKRHTGDTPSSFTSPRMHAVCEQQPPMIPATTTFARASDDIALWIYSGTATVTTPGYCRFMGAGETVTIPSGTSTRLDVSAGSVALPVPLAAAHDDLTLSDVLAASVNPLAAVELQRLSAQERADAEQVLVPSV